MHQAHFHTDVNQLERHRCSVDKAREPWCSGECLRFQKDNDVGSVSTITGSEGIGKSWTLFYALQQALLYDGATVLFFFEKYGRATMYHRRKSKLYAWTTCCHERASSYLFQRTDVLVLLDPREANDKGAHFCMGAMKLLYVASNNKNLISSSAEKENGNMQKHISGRPSAVKCVSLLHTSNLRWTKL